MSNKVDSLITIVSIAGALTFLQYAFAVHKNIAFNAFEALIAVQLNILVVFAYAIFITLPTPSGSTKKSTTTD